MPNRENEIPEANLRPGMTPEEIRDAEYRALVQGQRTLIRQMLEVSRAQRNSEKRYDLRLDTLEFALAANTTATNSVKTDTADLVGALKAIQGGMTVLGWLGKFAKPLLMLGVPGAIVLATWNNSLDALKAIWLHK